MRRKPKYLDRRRRKQLEALAQEYCGARRRVSDLLRQQLSVRLIGPEHDPLMKTLD